MSNSRRDLFRSWRRIAILVSIAAAESLFLSSGASAQHFTEVDPGLPKPPYPCVVAGDYDGDGDPDLLVTGSGKHDVPFTTIYDNVGGTFTDSGIVLLGLSRASAAWGDFDGDGDLDLAITGLSISQAATTVIYRNDGATFTNVAGGALGVFAGSVAWGDFDGDADLDLLVTGDTVAGSTGVAATRLYRNDSGVFTSVSHPFPDCYVGAAEFGDYDGDGDVDLVLTGVETSSALTASVWRNDGGTFTDAGVNLPGMDLGFAVWGDYDTDGDLDLLFGGNSNDGFISRVYRNDGGTFTDAKVGLLGLLWSSAAWGDYDADGDPDAMLIGYDPVAQSTRSILYRNDAGSFVDSGDSFRDLYLGTVLWFDYDSDADLDLLLAGNDSGLDQLVLENSDLTGSASWSNYGTGFPGTNGVPAFTSRAAPVLGTTLTLDLANSRGASTSGLLFIGLQRASIHSNWGGDLLLLPFLTDVVPLSSSGISFTGNIPNDPALTGFAIDLQSIEDDPGAAKGVSFTQGLELVLGH